MLNGQQIVVASLESQVFTEALAAGAASALYQIPAPQAVHNSRLKGIEVTSTAQFAAELDLWRSFVGQPTADPQTDTWIGSWGFSEASFQQIGGAGLWRSVIYGIDIPYLDLPYGSGPGDVPAYLYAMLVNRSAVKTKQVYPTDKIVVRFFMEPSGSLTV